MDQEDCATSQEKNKSLTRSTARHIRRARLKSTLKAEKERALISNENHEIATKKEVQSKDCIEDYDKLKDTLSKTELKKWRKKCRKCISGDNSEVNTITPATTVNLNKIIDNSQEQLGEDHKKILITDTEKCKLAQCPKPVPKSGQTVLKKDKVNQTVGESLTETQKEHKSPVEAKKQLKMVDGKEDTAGKSKEEIKAERDARRAAKLVAKGKAKDVKTGNPKESPVSQAPISNQVNSIGNKSVESKTSEASKAIESPSNNSVKEGQATGVKITENKTGKEDVKADREARRAAKVAAKSKAKGGKAVDLTKCNTPPTPSDTTDTMIKEIVSVTNTAESTEKLSAKDERVSDIKNDEGKSKADLRAERRAKQEAQRAAKQQKQQQVPVVPQLKKTQKPVQSEESIRSSNLKDLLKKPVTRKVVTPTKDTHEVNLFKHLYHERDIAIVDTPSLNSKIHPAIIRLGVQYANKVIVGSNARCIALLAAVKQLLCDFERPSQADFIRGLEANLQESAAYLHHCRPSAVSMQNALRHLKWQMTQLPSTLTDKEAKSKLCSAIEQYILEQIDLAGKAISITIQTKISNGDIILTYGYSSLINKILLDAHDAKKKFRVIVADGRPWLEGREQLRRLAKHGIECSYILINALSYVMPEVSKVFLGAHAILANGAVMSRAGTAQVALMAKSFNVPVLVACETHKSCERVQTDSIVYNELGNPDELVDKTIRGHTTKKSILGNWKTRKSLNLLNITYDVTPADLVTAVVTELAILPCTSVPVILRIKPSEI